MENNQSTVFLVDDDHAVRGAIELFLHTKYIAVETFSSAHDFLERYDSNQAGCLVLDVRMAGMSGLELQDLLVEKGVKIPIIFMSGHGDISMAMRAFKAGAVDFLEKPFDNDRLFGCVNDAFQRDIEFREEDCLKRGVMSRYEQLTPREREVMALVVNGLSNKEAARVLDISHRTVEIHRRRVMRKMDAGSVSDLMGSAMVGGVYKQIS
ncbi:MAG: response regulator [Gammaproteobacteria bacterium]|nr:response regulator [Gammaproteobacteria bacterium]